uniref:Collagen alpha-1(IV) chain-like n=1 Tax=Saccoglossus kowalevskii TaxID=10224 RepID=A0ABM0MCJ1_SACKO|nr:PREDICTED: collagen alpha-1(IV) chain-like [Saccoglossus kowalevskii]
MTQANNAYSNEAADTWYPDTTEMYINCEDVVCPATCDDVSEKTNCAECVPGCQCAEGTVEQDGECVDVSKCRCPFDICIKVQCGRGGPEGPGGPGGPGRPGRPGGPGGPDCLTLKCETLPPNVGEPDGPVGPGGPGSPGGPTLSAEEKEKLKIPEIIGKPSALGTCGFCWPSWSRGPGRPGAPDGRELPTDVTLIPDIGEPDVLGDPGGSGGPGRPWWPRKH